MSKETYYTKTTRRISEELGYDVWEVRLIVTYFFKSIKEIVNKGFDIDIYRIFKTTKKQ